MKKQPQDPRFRTHIPEPRWQVVISVVVVVLLIVLQLLITFKTIW